MPAYDQQVKRLNLSVLVAQKVQETDFSEREETCHTNPLKLLL